MNKQILIMLMGWWVALHALADIRVTAEASPTTVAVGEAFRLEYKVNSTDAEQIRPDAFNGVEVLNGPAVSTFSSYQLTNGRASSESSTTFTYILSPTREGTLTLPAATVSVGGRLEGALSWTQETSETTPSPIKRIKMYLSSMVQKLIPIPTFISHQSAAIVVTPADSISIRQRYMAPSSAESPSTERGAWRR